MSRVNISVEAMKLKRIQEYAKEKHIPVSKIFVRGAMSIVNTQPIKKCEYCHNPSIGRFRILTQDWEQGELTLEKYLCSFHLNQAKTESEVTEL